MLRFTLFVLVSGCGGTAGTGVVATGGYVPAERIATLAHPSTSDSVAENAIGTSRRLSLTKLTDAEICLDLLISATGTSEEAVLAAISKRMGKHTLGRCTPGRVRKDNFCVSNELPVTERFEPVVVGGPTLDRYQTSKEVPTGARETVCVEDQVNQYGTIVGCARFIEQDVTRKEYTKRERTVLPAEGGLRWCFKNEGIVEADSDGFDIALDTQRQRFMFTGGVPKLAPWGGTGGLPAIPSVKGGVQREAPSTEAASAKPEKPAAGKPKQVATKADKSVEPPDPASYKTNIAECDAFFQTVIECTQKKPEKSQRAIFDATVKNAAQYRELAKDPKKRKLAAETCVKQEQAARKYSCK